MIMMAIKCAFTKLKGAETFVSKKKIIYKKMDSIRSELHVHLVKRRQCDVDVRASHKSADHDHLE